MNDSSNTIATNRFSPYDLAAGLVVFLVAMPLCLGIAAASNAPVVSGVIAGVVGGIVVGLLSGSHTSIAGPAGGLIPIVAWQIQTLGSFNAFLMAGVIAGVLQIAMGLARLGFLASFAPTSVVKGLLAAIGIIVVLKQIPHVLGHDTDPEGEMSFFQVDKQNTFTELVAAFGDYHAGAAVIGLACLALLTLWGSSSRLKRSGVPGSLVAILLGIALSEFFARLGGRWAITEITSSPSRSPRRARESWPSSPIPISRSGTIPPSIARPWSSPSSPRSKPCSALKPSTGSTH